jgi:hypothetical protein
MNAGQAPKFERSSLSGLDFGSPLESFFLHSPQIPGPGLIWGSAGVALIGPFFFLSPQVLICCFKLLSGMYLEHRSI